MWRISQYIQIILFVRNNKSYEEALLIAMEHENTSRKPDG